MIGVMIGMKHVLVMTLLAGSWLVACGDDGGGGGVAADAPAGGADAQAGGADAPGAPDATVDATVDAMPLALGATCTDGAMCGSGHCVDGVCCDTACDSLCTSCRGADSGGVDGTCAPVTRGADPASECATDVCALGTCDGAGACIVRDNENTCRPSAGACDVAETCDGLMASCGSDQVAAAGVTCGDYLCDGVSSACPTSCSSDAGCATGRVCVGGACVAGRRAFTTSTTTTGALGGLSGGDAFCQNLANLAGLRGTYRAWLSDATGSPSTRFTRLTVPYYLVSGAMVAQSYTDLVDGTLGAAIEVTETGAIVPSNVPFTGTSADGTAFLPADGVTNHCVGWTSSSASHHAMCGGSGGTDSSWTQSSNGGAARQCNVLHRLYCFGQ